MIFSKPNLALSLALEILRLEFYPRNDSCPVVNTVEALRRQPFSSTLEVSHMTVISGAITVPFSVGSSTSKGPGYTRQFPLLIQADVRKVLC